MTILINDYFINRCTRGRRREVENTTEVSFFLLSCAMSVVLRASMGEAHKNCRKGSYNYSMLQSFERFEGLAVD